MTQGAESHPEGEAGRPLPLRPEGRSGANAGGSGPDLDSAAKIVDALLASAEQEFQIAERLSSKARQAFALAVGFFIVGQTVAFGGFEAKNLSAHEKDWIIRLAVGTVVALAVAAASTLKADATYKSGDLPLEKLEADLNAAYQGDPDVIGNLGSYYLGVVRTRRAANKSRRLWYWLARGASVVALGATVAELVFSLLSRTS